MDRKEMTKLVVSKIRNGEPVQFKVTGKDSERDQFYGWIRLFQQKRCGDTHCLNCNSYTNPEGHVSLTIRVSVVPHDAREYLADSLEDYFGKDESSLDIQIEGVFKTPPNTTSV